MGFPERTITMSFQDAEGGAIVVACEVEGDRVVRTAGLMGDSLTIIVPAADWPLPAGPVGIDLTKPAALVFGYVAAPGDADEEAPVRLEHYYYRQADPVMVSANTFDAAADASKSAKAVKVRLVTLPAMYRADGRGGRIKERTFNKLLSGGEVDETHANYRPNSSLVDICLTAMGLMYETSPVSLDEIPPPGALDWGNASPVIQLDPVLARIGHEIALPNTGEQLRIFQLPKFADDIELDEDIAERLAQDFVTTKSPALRGSTIIVHSEDTKTTVLTHRGVEEMEWVCFHPAGRVWLNDTQVSALTSPENDIQPGSIDAFMAGPDPVDKAKAARYGRLFRALRLTGDDKDLRPIQAWEPMTFQIVPEPVGPEAPTTFTMGSMAACFRGTVSRRIDGGTLVPMTVGGEGDGTSAQEVEAHSEAGVFVLPEQFVFVAPPSPSVVGPFPVSNAALLTDENFRVYFAHEAAFTDEDAEGFGGLTAFEGAFALNYFVAGFSAARVGDDLVLTKLTGEDLADAMNDPFTVWMGFSSLRRVVRFAPGDDEPTEINRAALEEIAEDLARTKASVAMAEGGIATARGWMNKSPGCCSGACSMVTWDLRNHRTSFVLNDHEVPNGRLWTRAVAAGRSFATGVIGTGWMGGGTLGTGARSDTRGRSTPGSPSTPLGIAAAVVGPAPATGNNVEIAAATRGVEAEVGPARPASELPGGSMAPPAFAPFLAKITVATALPGNRWAYQFNQAVPVIVGAEVGTFTSVTGGLTNATHGAAYNLAEASNDGSGVEGNGINVSNLPSGWSIQPIPVGAVVLIEMCIADSEGNKACFFYRENTVDGACPSSGGAGGGGGGELRPSSDGDVDAIDALFVSRDGEVFLDRDRSAFVSDLSAGVSQSDLNAVTSVFTSRTGAFFTSRSGNLFAGRHHGEVSASSQQLVNRIFVSRDGRPFTSRTGNVFHGR